MVQGWGEKEVAQEATQQPDTATHWAVPSMEVIEMEQVLKAAGIEKAELAKMIAELIRSVWPLWIPPDQRDAASRWLARESQAY